MKKVLSIVLISGLVLSFAGCKKKEEKPLLPSGHPSMEGGMPAGAGTPNTPSVPKVERAVVVSKEVAARWKAVKLAVDIKTSKTRTELTVPIGSEQAIPKTNLTVKVLAFLPDFKMTDKEIYSSSDKPNQPAAQIVVTENGKELWSNWLFSLQPTIHPFQHENVGIVLVSGVAK